MISRGHRVKGQGHVPYKFQIRNTS